MPYKIITEGDKQWVVRPTMQEPSEGDIPKIEDYGSPSALKVASRKFVNYFSEYEKHLASLPRYLWLGPKLTVDELEDVRIGWQTAPFEWGNWIDCSEYDFKKNNIDEKFKRMVAHPVNESNVIGYTDGDIKKMCDEIAEEKYPEPCTEKVTYLLGLRKGMFSLMEKIKTH